MPKPHRPARNPTTSRPRRSAADLALAERLLAAARGGGDVRGLKVRRIKGAIKADAYENDLKLGVAIDRLLAAVSPRKSRR